MAGLDILQLLQAVTGGNPQGADINVMAKRPSVSEEDPAPLNLGNRSAIEEAQQAATNAPEHRGMFNTKGTLRDILGLVGDAFLTQGGRDKVYAPQRQKEREGDALAGFTQNPMAAVERMVMANPEAAQKLFGEVQQRAAQTTTANAAMQKAQGDQQTDAQKLYSDNYRLIGQALGAANEKTYPRMKAIAEKFKQAGGIGDELQIPDTYDPDFNNSLRNGVMPATAQVQADDRDASRAQQREIADQSEAGKAARYTPPQPRAEPKVGLSNVDASVAEAVLNGNATPAQQKYFDNRLKRQSKGGALGELLNGASPGGSPAPLKLPGEGKFVRQGGRIFKIVNGKPVAQ